MRLYRGFEEEEDGVLVPEAEVEESCAGVPLVGRRLHMMPVAVRFKVG
jgi:hypothetical protein